MLSDTGMPGVDPATIWELDNLPDVSVSVRWSPAGSDLFDVVVSRGAKIEFDFSQILPSGQVADSFAQYTNHPLYNAGTEITTQLRTYLKDKLPEYMVPSAFVLIDEIPLTPNGKLDRAALPAPENGHREITRTCVKPANELEEAVADIWNEILGIEQIGTDQSFFHVGGHSLLATQLVSRLRATFRVGISLREVFDYPTIEGIADRLARSEAEPGQVYKIAQIMKKVKQMPDQDQGETIFQKAQAR